MANLPETPVFTPDIYQIETTDKVLGGPDGVVNLQSKQIADRTAWLKQEVEAAAAIAVSGESKADSALAQVAAAETAMGSAAASAASALLYKNDALAAKALAEQARSDAQAAAVDASAAATGAAADRVTAGQRAAEAQASATSAVNAASFVQADRVAAQTARNEAVGAQSAAEAAALAADADRVAAEAARTGAEAAQAAVYGDLASSAAGKGAELVEYQGATVEAALNERLPEIGTYALLRAYAGPVTAFLVRGVENIFDGGFGPLRVDASDTTSADNGIDILVDAAGRRWKRDSGNIIDPAWSDAATAKAKIEAAITRAIAARKVLVFSRMMDITGQGSISITKPFSPRWFLSIKGVGGGIKKTDAGYVFTSAITDTGDFQVQGMRFESTPGAGTVLWNGNQIVRVYSSHNQYIGWDTIAEANTRWLQQYELIDEHISGGRGWLVSFRENWGCKFVRINIEDRNYNRETTIDIASSTLTTANHGMPNGFVVYITTTGALPTGLTPAGTTNAGKYFVVNATTDTYQLSATSGGAAITLSGTQSGTHKIYYGDGHGIGNSEDLAAIANRNLIVSQCVFENNNGTFLRLCGSFASTISDNYTEAIRGDHIDMQSFKTYPHYGLKVTGNIFGEKNPDKYTILWGKVAGSNVNAVGGAVSENNASDNKLHLLDSLTQGYILSAGDYAAGTFIGGPDNRKKYLIIGTQYLYATNADGSSLFKQGTMRKLTASKSVTLTAGIYQSTTIPFAVGTLDPNDVVSVTTTNGYQLEILSAQVAAGGTSVVVWLKNLDTANPITRTLYCTVLQMVI